MKKIYVFNNYYSKSRGKNPLRSLEVEAETILEAKKEVERYGHKDMQFATIRVVYGKIRKVNHENRNQV